MVNYLTLTTFNGRLFINPPIPENDGLLAVIDFKQKNKAFQPIYASFNGTGDSFLIADSRGQVTYFQVANNRYLVINQTNQKDIACALFTGKYPLDQAFFVFKDKSAQIHSLNGKLLEKYNGIHDLEIKGGDLNYNMNQFLTYSAESCHIWTNSGSNGTILKQRSIFAKDGMIFVEAQFSTDGQSVATLLKDGSIIQWGLDTAALLDAQILSLSLKSNLIKCFDFTYNHVVAGGKDLSCLIYKVISGSNKGEHYLNLPIGCRGIEQMQLLADKNLLTFLSEGQIFIVDLSTQSQNEGKIQVKLNLRLPKESIKQFRIDTQMNLLLLLTNGGNAYMYDLPKALENERIISKKKLEMGLEKDIVYTFLQKVNEDEMSQIRQNQDHFKSTISQEQINSNLPSFMNPLISQSQRQIESQEYQVSQSMNTIINPFVQKSMMEIQRNKNNPLEENMVSIQSEQIQRTKKGNLKQDIMNSGLSTTLAKNSVFKKPQASIVQSTMSGFNPNFSNIKSVISGNHQKSLNSQINTNQSQIESKYILDENFQPDYNFTQSTLTSTQLAHFNMPKLKQMLKQFGEYPDKYRFLTWKYLLELPLNKETYSNLVRRGIHPAFKNLHKLYPIAQHKLYNKLVRTLSALGYWSPIFLDVDYLPAIVFPFIKVVSNDDLLVFELMISLIVQYMQNWFEAYPSDPLNLLQALDQIIQVENQALNAHLKSHSFSANIYGWPIIKNIFTEVLSKDDWLKLMDHLFTFKEDPELIIYFAAAYLLSNKGALMNITTAEELHNFQSTPTGIPFKKIMVLTFKLHSKLSQQIFTGHISQNLPLIKVDPQNPQISGEYPLFNRYPEHIVQNQQKTRAKIALEEEEILRKQYLLEELRDKSEQILINEENIRRQQEAALQAELERKLKVQNEQELLLQERIRLDEMTRLAKLEHIKKLEEAVMGAMTRQEELKKEENKVAEEELNQRQRLAQYEYQARLQDEMINNMEFKANQRMLELMQKNQSEEQIRKMKSEFDQRQREDEHRDKVVQERWRLEDQEQKLKNELFRQAMQQQTQTMKQLSEKAKIEEKFRKQEHDKELQLLQIEEQRRLRSLEEEQILRKQQMLEEMRMRGETLTKQEIEQKWALLNYEREREKERANLRMEEIERERNRLDLAIELEREEKERFEEIQRRIRNDEDIAMNKTILSNFSEQQNDQAEFIKRQLQQEREEAEFRRIEMMRKEAQMREQEKQNEKSDLMQLIRNTGENINNIVEKGQRDLEERKINRYQQQQQSNPLKVREYEPLRFKGQSVDLTLDQKIQERERQLKEQNERLLKQYSEEKENSRSQINRDQIGIPPYAKPIISNLQTQSFNPYAQTQNALQNQNQNGQQQYYSNVTSDPTTSSMSESESSLSSSHGDAEAIKKHYQIKHQVEEYHKNFNSNPTKVFTYQPQPQQPPAQLRGHHLPEQVKKQEKQTKSKQKEDQLSSLSSQEEQQESYYNSSSSSNSSDEDEEESDSNTSQSNNNVDDSQSLTESQLSIKQSAQFPKPQEAYSHPQMGSQQSAHFNQNFSDPQSIQQKQMLQSSFKMNQNNPGDSAKPMTFQSDDYSSLSSSSSQSHFTASPQKDQTASNRRDDRTGYYPSQDQPNYGQSQTQFGQNPFTTQYQNYQPNIQNPYQGSDAYNNPSSNYKNQSYYPTQNYQNEISPASEEQHSQYYYEQQRQQQIAQQNQQYQAY